MIINLKTAKDAQHYLEASCTARPRRDRTTGGDIRRPHRWQAWAPYEFYPCQDPCQDRRSWPLLHSVGCHPPQLSIKATKKMIRGAWPAITRKRQNKRRKVGKV